LNNCMGVFATGPSAQKLVDFKWRSDEDVAKGVEYGPPAYQQNVQQEHPHAFGHMKKHHFDAVSPKSQVLVDEERKRECSFACLNVFTGKLTNAHTRTHSQNTQHVHTYAIAGILQALARSDANDRQVGIWCHDNGSFV